MIKKYCDNLQSIRFSILMALLSEKKITQGNQKRSIFLFVSLETFGIYLDEFQEFT